jgi:hypothetical protein
MGDAATTRTVAKLVASGTLLACLVIYGATLTAPAPAYKMVDDLTVFDRGRDLEVHGWIRAGSMTHLGDRWWFTLHRNGKAVRVVVPAIEAWMRDQSEVVMAGRLDARGELFVGTGAYAKCAVQYDRADLEQKFR